jgi:hypothetical protein
MIEVARMLKRRFENIITYLRHRITNAASESINAKIQWVKYTARGFRNKQNFIHAIVSFRQTCVTGPVRIGSLGLIARSGQGDRSGRNRC